MMVSITKNEFRALVVAGLASSTSYNDSKAGAVGRFEHIEVDGKNFTQSLYAEEHGYSWQSTASGSTIFLKAENGDVLKVTQIRYTKNGTTEGDQDAERILRRFSSNRGGFREGSGRKPSETPKSTWSVKVTEQEKIELKKYLDKIRGN